MIEVWRSTSTLLRAAEETTDSHPVQTLYFLNLTYLNIQIIACVKAHHNPGIVICPQREPQRAAVDYLEDLPQHWAYCASPKQPPACSTHQS